MVVRCIGVIAPLEKHGNVHISAARLRQPVGFLYDRRVASPKQIAFQRGFWASRHVGFCWLDVIERQWSIYVVDRCPRFGNPRFG